MNEKKFMSSSDFMKSKMCNAAAGLEDLNVKAQVESERITNTSIFKAVAKQYLKGGKLADLFDEEDIIKDVSEIEQIIVDAYTGQTDNDSEKSEEANLGIIAKGCRRYCRWEQSLGRRDSDDWAIMFDQRIFVTAVNCPELVSMIPNLKKKDIMVPFDVIFVNEKDHKIEGICYKGNTAWLGTGATSKNKPEDDIWFNLMLKALETLVPEEETYSVTASYYHMKPKNVRREQGDWEFVSFDHNSSVISFSEDYSNTEAFKSVPTIQDELLKAALDDLYEGHDCTPEDCKSCFLNCSCNFIKSADIMEEKEQKKGKKVDPSDDQKKVIDWDNGILVVVAGAGAGKTECSAEHMLHLILKEIDQYTVENDCSKSTAADVVLKKFFMTTFTNAGVFEMKERMLGKLAREEIFVDADALNIMTFNTFAFNIVKEYYEELGFEREPVVIDDIRNAKIIVDLLNENPVDGLNYESFTMSAKEVIGALPMTAIIFERMKKLQLNSGSFDVEKIVSEDLGYRFTHLLPTNALSGVIDLYDQYEERLKEEGLVLFADQEPMAMQCLKNHPEYLENLGYEHLVVDEFQDSNDIQMQFVKMLCQTKSYKSLVVVGDDFQAIYGFRDTSPENMIHFGDKIQMPVTQHFLVDNYRSTPEIIGLSNKFIKNNKDQIPKDLVAFRPSGKKPVVRGFYDKEEEYSYVVEKVQKILSEGKYIPEDICIIAATNDELTAIAAKLSEQNIPVVMKNPQKYIENSRVRAAIALANAVWNPNATENYFQYLVAKYNGELVKEFTTDEILEMIEEMRLEFVGFENLEFGFQRKKFHDYLDEIAGTDEIFTAFVEMLNHCEDFPSELDYINDFKKYGRDAAKRMDAMYQGVVLVTAHSSKGLEWPVVINVVDNYDNMTLHASNGKFTKKQIEDKRRLLYVSMTRARDELYVIGKYVIAEGGVSAGVVIPLTYNRFLREVFDILDKKGYVPVDPNADLKKSMRKEKADAEKAERERRKALRQAQSLLAKYKGDKTAMEKAIAEETASKRTRKRSSTSSRSREMTDAEKIAYIKQTAGAKQMTIEEAIAAAANN